MTIAHPQIQRCYDVALKYAWQHPFFLIPLGHCEWAEMDSGTMKVTTRLVGTQPEITLHINPAFVEQLPDAQVFGCLAHEILHVLLGHTGRAEGRDRNLWGAATDMAINVSLTEAGICLPDGCLFPKKPDWLDSADELYDKLPPQSTQNGAGHGGDGEPSVGQGCLPESEPGPGEMRALSELAAAAKQQTRGLGSVKSFAKLLAPRPVKIPWKRLLAQVAQRAASAGGRDMQSFQRPSRKSSDIIFPGWKTVKPSLCVIVDTSGSVSDEMLATSLSHVAEIGKLVCARTFLALHDGECYWSGWVPPEGVGRLSKRCTHRGGTDPAGAFRAVADAGARFDAAVYLTDGEVGAYPAKPSNIRRMVLAIVGGSRCRTPAPDSWQELLVDLK